MKNVILYILTVVIWGSTWIAITFQYGTVSPILSVSYRFLIASLALFLFCAATGRFKNLKFSKKEHAFIALQGLLLFALNYILVYFAEGHLSSGMVALCFSTMMIMNTFNQALFFKTRIEPKILAGGILGLAGMALTFWRDLTNITLENEIFIGVALSLVSAYTASLGNMAALRNSKSGLSVIECNTVGMAYGALFAFIAALIVGVPLTFEPSVHYIVSLLFLSVFGSAIAFGTYLTLLKNIGADRGSYTIVLIPLVALLISTIFENYHWRPEAFAGVALILLGNAFMIRKKKIMVPAEPKHQDLAKFRPEYN